ncbi:hypothetical protein PLANTIT3_80081 [Plantibacter sp. T3]|nr:hypothetical protein PLANTIT3_80081 [Plantibacter sp. T3]
MGREERARRVVARTHPPGGPGRLPRSQLTHHVRRRRSAAPHGPLSAVAVPRLPDSGRQGTLGALGVGRPSLDWNRVDAQ